MGGGETPTTDLTSDSYGGETKQTLKISPSLNLASIHPQSKLKVTKRNANLTKENPIFSPFSSLFSAYPSLPASLFGVL
jgi:hypothetical protein